MERKAGNAAGCAPVVEEKAEQTLANKRTRKLVIAIDGPAGSGKSSVAREAARRLGYLYVDTGAMYRAVALRALETKTPLDDAARLGELARNMRIQLESGAAGVLVLVDGRDVTEALRGPETSQATSRISVFQGVREVMTAAQQHLGTQGGVVMEGRDIGTVVFPDAEVKIFLDASPEVRAERRQAQLAAGGVQVEYEKLLAEIRERDRRDRERPAAPMERASDAIYVDSTALTIDEVVEAILEIAKRRGEDRAAS